MSETVFNPRAYQKAALADPARLQAWMWSRQTGKGFTTALKINQDILQRVAAGAAVDWLILSRSLVAARQLARKVRGIGRAMCQAMRIVEPTLREDLKERVLELEYPGGSRVLTMSSNPDAAVGFTGNVVIDEIDTHKQADELFGNTFAVASNEDRGGYALLVTSTPRGKKVMHRIYSDTQKEGSLWSFRKLTIHEAVAQGCPQDPVKLRRGILDERKWRQEYLCEFVDEAAQWIPWELLTAGVDDQATLAADPRLLEHETFAGWDVARWHDLSVLWLIERLGPLRLTRIVEVMQRMPLTQQVERVATLLGRCRSFRRVCVDVTGGMGLMPVEALQQKLGAYRVEGVNFTTAVKEDLAVGVRRALEDRNFRLPDDEGVFDDFHSLQRSETKAGNARFEGEAKGSHADRFWAAALALHAAGQTGGAITGPSGIRVRPRERGLTW